MPLLHRNTAAVPKTRPQNSTKSSFAREGLPSHTQCEFLPHRRLQCQPRRYRTIYTRRYRTQRRNDLHEAVPNAKTKRFTRGGTERKDETIYTSRYRTQRRNDLHEAVPNAKTKRFTDKAYCGNIVKNRFLRCSSLL